MGHVFGWKFERLLRGATLMSEESTGNDNEETEQENEQQQQGRGNTHNGPTFPKRES
jgi:hypothetical protein